MGAIHPKIWVGKFSTVIAIRKYGAVVNRDGVVRDNEFGTSVIGIDETPNALRPYGAMKIL